MDGTRPVMMPPITTARSPRVAKFTGAVYVPSLSMDPFGVQSEAAVDDAGHEGEEDRPSEVPELRPLRREGFAAAVARERERDERERGDRAEAFFGDRRTCRVACDRTVALRGFGEDAARAAMLDERRVLS